MIDYKTTLGRSKFLTEKENEAKGYGHITCILIQVRGTKISNKHFESSLYCGDEIFLNLSGF